MARAVQFKERPRTVERAKPAGDAADPARPRRRRQADRSAATRERVIAAAVELLHRHGYSGATTLAIAREAGVSLGALQHQFPTKALLMASVVRRFAAQRFLTYRAALRGVPNGLARFEALSAASWSRIGTPELAASMEIQLAMRNDTELAQAAAPMFERHNAFIRRLIGRMLADRPELDEQRVESIRLLNSAIMLGMSMLTVTSGKPEAVDLAINTWRETLMQHLLPPSSHL